MRKETNGEQALSEQPFDTVELQLASAASDLAPALDAAQYGRLVQPEDPESEQEADAMTAFIEAFATCTETWETGTGDQRTRALRQLDARIEALESIGLHVHAGMTRVELTQPGQAALPMPVAILTITSSSLPTTTVLVPTDLGVSDEGMTSH